MFAIFTNSWKTNNVNDSINGLLFARFLSDLIWKELTNKSLKANFHTSFTSLLASISLIQITLSNVVLTLAENQFKASKKVHFNP